MRLLRSSVLLAMWMAAPAMAEWGKFDYDFDADKKPWQEIQTQLPAYPTTTNLIPFAVSSASRHRHFID